MGKGPFLLGQQNVLMTQWNRFYWCHWLRWTSGIGSAHSAMPTGLAERSIGLADIGICSAERVSSAEQNAPLA